MSKEEADTHWEEIMDVINDIEAREESFLWVGDLNRHVGKLIPGNVDKTTYGGDLLIQFLKSDRYVLVNSSNKSSGGPWTRVNPADHDSRSVLDLAIISKDLFKYLEVMNIDKDRKVTPFRVCEDYSHKHSDHFAVSLTFKGIPLKKENMSLGKKFTTWNTNKPNGWKVYRELTEFNE